MPSTPASYNFAKRPYDPDTVAAALDLAAEMIPALAVDAAKLRILSEGLADYHMRQRNHVQHSHFNRLHVVCEEFTLALAAVQ
jgi:hypothetical protein